ncbi:hypothetical protein [Clostridium sp. CF012]|uniref:hypothetical protein n=1 Tax=Clostridium sp. CF012 TaxID=2843319 RepID=UPI001C0CD12A|nr:hypothetical protein [Clostridium sp. CF012]MBU3144765.1 hypothetical protein [Clostridium sp. CF012]
MSEQIIQQYIKSSFLKRQFFSLKVIGALKNCKRIKEYLLSKDYLSKFDNNLNLITSDGYSNEVVNSYLLYKGYNKDGSIKPTRKYTIINGEIVEHRDAINCDIIILDLYEKSIYLHNHIRDDNYITGYLVKEEKISEKNKTLIFSNEKVKINIKNINKCETINAIDDFVNKFIM